MNKFDGQINETNQAIKSLTAYLLTKVELKDWHAVADAAMDIRELVAKIEVYRELE